MPVTFTSARFVGREDAFARLASVLQSASAGDAGTLLIDGTSGVGTTRFIDEIDPPGRGARGADDRAPRMRLRCVDR